MSGIKIKKVKYPRLYVSQTTLDKIKRMAKKRGFTIAKMGNKVAIAGLKALAWE